MYSTVAREGWYYVIDMDSGQRVSPALPSDVVAKQFLQMVSLFGPPPVELLLQDGGFDYMAWMKHKKDLYTNRSNDANPVIINTTIPDSGGPYEP